MNILLYCLLTPGFCYFQTSIYSIILSSLHTFFHLQIYGNSFQGRSKTHYATKKLNTSVGCLHIFDDIIWFSYNTETKSTQFNCPTLATSFNAFVSTRKIWAWPQQCFQTIFHFREEKADVAVFSWDSGNLYCQLKHSKTFLHCLIFLELLWYAAQTLEDSEEETLFYK